MMLHGRFEKTASPKQTSPWPWQNAILMEALSPTTPILLVVKKCPQVTKSSVGCEVKSWNMADEDTLFLRWAGDDERRHAVEKHHNGPGQTARDW